MSKKVRINELLDYIRNGRIIEAMHEFYAENAVMEEPAYGKTIGLEANVKREGKFLEGVAEFKKFEATPAVGENFSSYENVMEWTSTDGQEVRIEQVAVQHWRDGKIVHERFYYNTD
jgi:hypothetical protein